MNRMLNLNRAAVFQATLHLFTSVLAADNFASRL